MRGERLRLFVSIGVLALLWRLVHLLALRDLEFFGVLGLDAEFYDRWARSLAAGEAQAREVYFQGPLYPYFLSLIYRVGGGSLLSAQLVQMVLGSLSAAFAALTAREIFGPRAGWIAGILSALYGFAIFLETHLVAAPLLGFLLMAALWSCLGSSQRPWQLLIGGLLFGMAAILRGNVLMACGLCILILLGLRRFRMALLLAAGIAIAVAPVALRNLSVGGEFTLLSANGGINYFIGNHEGASGLYEEVDGVDFFQSGMPHDGGSIAEARRRSSRDDLNAGAASRWWLAEALRWQRSQPLAATKLFLRKCSYLFVDYEIPQIENFEWARSESSLLRSTPFRYGVLVGLGLVGMLLAWRRGGRARMLLLAIAFYWLSVASFFVTARFRVVVVPALAIFGAFALLEIVEALRRGALRKGLLAAGAAIALAALSFAGTPATHREGSQQTIAYSRGVIAMQQGDFALAVREFQAAAAQNPNDVAAWANLGYCQEQIGQTELALRSFEAALTLEPGNARVLEPYATSLLRAGRFDEAQRRLEELVGIDPVNWFGWASLGDLALQRGEEALGRSHWQRVLDGDAPADLKAMARERLQ